jgi:hypothetical protein
LKKVLLISLLAGLLSYAAKLNAQSSAATLDVVSWNLEWCGATFDGPTNEDLQRENAKKITHYLDADIY